MALITRQDSVLVIAAISPWFINGRMGQDLIGQLLNLACEYLKHRA
jgi:hypothetical protein